MTQYFVLCGCKDSRVLFNPAILLLSYCCEWRVLLCGSQIAFDKGLFCCFFCVAVVVCK